MKDYAGCKRQFIHLSQAYYGKALLKERDYVDIVTIGMCHKDGGTLGEFSVKWYELGKRVVPRLECFDDAWEVLGDCFCDLLMLMGKEDDTNISPLAFCDILRKLKIEDYTMRENPSAQPEKCPTCGQDVP